MKNDVEHSAHRRKNNDVEAVLKDLCLQTGRSEDPIKEEIKTILDEYGSDYLKDDIIKKNYCRKLKQARVAARLTASEAAKRLGLRKGAIYKAERACKIKTEEEGTENKHRKRYPIDLARLKMYCILYDTTPFQLLLPESPLEFGAEKGLGCGNILALNLYGKSEYKDKMFLFWAELGFSSNKHLADVYQTLACSPAISKGEWKSRYPWKTIKRKVLKKMDVLIAQQNFEEFIELRDNIMEIDRLYQRDPKLVRIAVRLSMGSEKLQKAAFAWLEQGGFMESDKTELEQDG